MGGAGLGLGLGLIFCVRVLLGGAFWDGRGRVRVGVGVDFCVRVF